MHRSFILFLIIGILGVGAGYFFGYDFGFETGVNLNIDSAYQPKTSSNHGDKSAKKNFIAVTSPLPYEAIKSPLIVRGEARGYWFFEATFPLVLVDWDGRIIAQSYAEAQGEWMTEAFVPFQGTIEFDSPYEDGFPDFMQHGALILQKSNASGLPEHDDALEIPLEFK